MTHHCDLAEEHIIFYALDDLRGARQEYVEAHIACCPDCQRRLAEFREITRLLQESSVPTDDAVHRATLQRAIGQDTRDHDGWLARFRRTALQGTVSYWQPMLVAGLLLALALLFLAPEASQAGFPLGRAFNFITEPIGDVSRVVPGRGESEDAVIPEAGSPPFLVSELPFQPATPNRLPLGLELIEQTRPELQRLESVYQNTDGLGIRLVQMPTADADVGISTAGSERVSILDTMVVQHMDPRGDAVAGIYWAREGFTFLLFVLEAPTGGLSTRDAHAIVEGVMHAQEDELP